MFSFLAKPGQGISSRCTYSARFSSGALLGIGSSSLESAMSEVVMVTSVLYTGSRSTLKVPSEWRVCARFPQMAVFVRGRWDGPFVCLLGSAAAVGAIRILGFIQTAVRCSIARLRNTLAAEDCDPRPAFDDQVMSRKTSTTSVLPIATKEHRVGGATRRCSYRVKLRLSPNGSSSFRFTPLVCPMQISSWWHASVCPNALQTGKMV